MCLYQPTSLTWRATKNPSPDFVLLLEIPNLLAQPVQWWDSQMAHLHLTSPHLTSTSTKDLPWWPQHFLNTTLLLCAHSENRQYPKDCLFPHLMDFLLVKCSCWLLPVPLMWTASECNHMWLSYLGLRKRPQPVSREKHIPWRRWSA